MARILVTQQLVESGIDLLTESNHDIIVWERTDPASHEDLVAAAREFDAIVCLLTDRIDAEVLGSGSRLKVVANVAVGTDNIDLRAAQLNGITICNTPGVLDESTADLAVLLMLSARRRASTAETDLRAGRWKGWGLGDHLGLDLSGSTVALIGFGRIGRAVEARVAAFGAEVLHHTRSDTGLAGWRGSLAEILSVADVISLHVPLTEETRHLINAEALRIVKPTAVLINTARGPVVDEEAVADALGEGRLWGAGFDVFVGEPRINSRILAAPNTTLLPHIGSATVKTRRAMCELACQGVLSVLAGEQPSNLVHL